ncbi:MAG: 2-C-methyl-D-erythritol 4-phosphate cytidylyltransferase [Pseudohongiella sp.]|nr:2-C-methyl-D-erythritol 4-phosphate cytidylyltransferase [Pseudohongiella sp.]
MVYAIIPAAGIGSRMQSTTPKQYLPLLDGNVLLYSIRALLALPEIRLLMIALHPDDRWWPETEAMLRPDERRRIQICVGGAERWQSVEAALSALTVVARADRASDAEHWVMVHDAVRPCVRLEDLRALLGAHNANSNGKHAIRLHGALLAAPVSDTLKKADSSLTVFSTVDRTGLWAACTPQMFRIDMLQQALRRAAAAGVSITDEASAMEFCGSNPTLVPCAKDNIKITYPEDLNLASWILKSRYEHKSVQQAGGITE